MNVFGEMLGKLTGGARGEGGTQALVSAVLDMLKSHPEGLSGLAQMFQQKGLGDIAASWIGTGQNLPVSADQIQDVLGSGQLQSLARKAGISEGAAGSQLAALLPSLIDKLTPGGTIPQGEDLTSSGMGILESFLSGHKPEP